MENVTELIELADAGDPGAAARLLPLVYDELRRLAASKVQMERSGLIDATELVHEAYVRLVGPAGDPASERQPMQWRNRRHFFAAAAEAMRRILVDNARQKLSLKRGGDRHRDLIEPDQLPSPESDSELIDLDDALAQFAVEHPQKAELVKLRYFTGLTSDQAAEVLGISSSTADRSWIFAKAWLRCQISK